MIKYCKSIQGSIQVSTGRITEDIGVVLLKSGYRSIIAAAYTEKSSSSEVIQVGYEIDRIFHGIRTRLFDRHGFGSKNTTGNL
jgi:hypothetical protein